MTQDESKALVARAAIAHVTPGALVGVGTGTTVGFFIEALASMPQRIAGAVSSSERSTALLREHGILIIDDYGHWQGAKKAVDEYFLAQGRPVYLHRIDYTGRALVKVGVS